MFPNLHSSPSTTTSTPVHETSPFQMGTFFLPQPFYNQAPHNNTTPQPNNEVTPPYFPNSYSNVLYQPIHNQEVDPSSSPRRDRHTKISTAQGVRDRRVRLSMGIAREFFDLQDMLGFDRASKTLGWLLANSKEAIQELALEKKGSFSPGTNDDAIGSSSSGALMRRKKRRKCSDSAREKNCCKIGSCEISQVNCNKSFVVRENREKARARARKRTREKLSTTMAEPVRFDLHHHGFQANGSSECSSTLLVDSKADQGLNQSKLVDCGTKSSNDLTNLVSSAGYSQNHPIAPRGDQGWNFYNFPNWQDLDSIDLIQVIMSLYSSSKLWLILLIKAS